MKKFLWIILLCTLLNSNANSQIRTDIVDKLYDKIFSCWKPAKMENMVVNPWAPEKVKGINVKLEIFFNSNGTVKKIKHINKLEMNKIFASTGNPNRYSNWNTHIVATAKSAVKKCQPYNLLPKEYYEAWKVITVYLDPVERLKGKKKITNETINAKQKLLQKFLDIDEEILLAESVKKKAEEKERIETEKKKKKELKEKLAKEEKERKEAEKKKKKELKEKLLAEKKKTKELKEKLLAKNQKEEEAELLAKKKEEEERLKLEEVKIYKSNTIKKIIEADFKDNDFIIMANLTSTAPHALYNLEGEISFDKNSATYCYFNSSNLDKSQDIYIKKILIDKYGIKYFNFQNNCDFTSILKNDIIMTQIKNIISLKNDDFSNFKNLFAKNDLRLINFKRLQDIEIFFELRKEKSKELKNLILISGIEGFGSIVLTNTSKELCLVIPEDQKKHLFLINTLNDEYALTGYEKNYNSIKFGSVEEIFRNIQRDKCGFLYTNQTNLKILIKAMDKASIEHELISKWFYSKDIEQAELLEQGELIKQQNTKLEKQKKLSEEVEKKKNSGELLKEYTAKLRKKHEMSPNGFKNFAHNEFATFYLNKIYEENLFKDTSTQKFYKDQFLKGWESSEFNIETIDYGSGIYKDREIEAHIINIYTKMKNNKLGEYKYNCFQLAVLEDKEFNYYRNMEFISCDDKPSLRKWFLANQFKTLWNPTLKDIAN